MAEQQQDAREIFFAFVEIFTNQAINIDNAAAIAAERTGRKVEDIQASAKSAVEFMLAAGLDRLKTLDDIALFCVGAACGATFVEHGGSRDFMPTLVSGEKLHNTPKHPNVKEANNERADDARARAEAAYAERQMLMDAGRWKKLSKSQKADFLRRHGYGHEGAMRNAFSKYRLSDLCNRLSG